MAAYSRSTMRGGVWACVGCLALPGCADQIVGLFSSDTGGSGGASSSSSSGSVLDDSSAGGFSVPGCFSDDFEDGVIDDDLWNLWVEEDSVAEEAGGWLKFTPPSAGLFDTGLVSHFDYRFAFDQGWARLQVVQPPDPSRPVVLFLMVGNDVEIVAISVSESIVSVAGTVNEQDVFRETFPAGPYPAWIGIRGDGAQVHFETSDDGEVWTTIATHDKPGALAESGALIMAQTYGDDADRGTVSVDNLEVCLQ